jgi:hypothetical protein
MSGQGSSGEQARLSWIPGNRAAGLTLDLLADEEADGGEHSDAAVGQLHLSVPLQECRIRRRRWRERRRGRMRMRRE